MVNLSQANSSRPPLRARSPCQKRMVPSRATPAQSASVCGKRKGNHALGVAVERQQHRSGYRVPKSHGAVVPARRQALAVSAEREPMNPLKMSAQAPSARSSIHRGATRTSARSSGELCRRSRPR